jgi:hypothetical protein
MKITVKSKVDQKVPPGALMSARIEIGGNGGCTVYYDHAPEKSKGNSSDGPCGFYQPRRPDIFGSIEEACHAIVQAAGGNSSLDEYDAAEVADKGKKA